MENSEVTPQAEQKPQTEFEAVQERILSATVDKILGEVQRIAEPFQRRALQRALDRIPVETPEEQDQTKATPRLQVGKAVGDFRMIVKWLQDRTIDEKLIGLAFSVLIDSGVQTSIQRRGLYKGEIGQDLDRDWDDAITAILETEEGRRSVSPEILSIASYLMGISAGSY
jgi:hypothetical protein